MVMRQCESPRRDDVSAGGDDVSAGGDDGAYWGLLYGRIRFDPATDDVLEIVTDVGRHMDAASVGFDVIAHDRLMVLKPPFCPPAYLAAFQYRHVDEELPVTRAFRTRTPVFLTSRGVRTEHPLLWPFWRAAGVCSAAVLPLLVEAGSVGILTFTYRDRRDWGGRDRSLLLALAPAVAQAVERATR